MSTNRPIRLLLVDDHTLFRRGLKALLSLDGRLEVAGEAGDLGEALRCLPQVNPDLVLLDNHLPGVRGVDGIGALKDALPGVRVLMLTVSENAEDLAAALQGGADGYLLKTMESEQLADTIEKVLAGDSVISPEMLTKLVSAFRQRPPSAPPRLPQRLRPRHPFPGSQYPQRRQQSPGPRPKGWNCSPPASAKSCSSSPRATATRPSAARSTSPRPPSRSTSSTSCASWA